MRRRHRPAAVIGWLTAGRGSYQAEYALVSAGLGVILTGVSAAGPQIYDIESTNDGYRVRDIRWEDGAQAANVALVTVTT